MPDIESRLAAIERKLQEAEDRLAIYQLIASYGPSVDSNSFEAVKNLWTEDGVYDIPSGRRVGREEVGRVIETDLHKSLVARGCGHVLSLPHIVISGDTAVATGYQNVFAREGKTWLVERTSVHRWELVRLSEGWKVKHRIARMLDGTEAHRAILGRAVRVPDSQ